MRVLTFILSLYILLLTGMPCVDEKMDVDLHHTELSGPSGNSRQDNSDHCSPFCSCNCCSIPVVLAGTPMLPPCNNFKHNEYSQVVISSFPSPYSTIWQPPKLS